jgi:hypothetical protein
VGRALVANYTDEIALLSWHKTNRGQLSKYELFDYSLDTFSSFSRLGYIEKTHEISTVKGSRKDT